MTELKYCYIIDKVENIGAYASICPAMKTAAEFIAKGDFASLAPGKNVIDGENVFVNNVEPEYVLKADRKPEVHHKYFDVHVPLIEDETIGLGVFNACAPGSFDEAGDGGLYEQEVTYFTVKKGEFCITYPITCAHAPAITATDAAHKSKKLIVKVKA